MRDFLQTVLPPLLAALVAYQGGLTRTTRLRSMIRASVDLVGTLPADHPSRAKLEAHIGELVDVLIRRQRRRFEPFTRAGVSFGANLTAALLVLGMTGSLALEEIGVLHIASEPPPPRERWTFIGFYTAVALCLAFFAFRAWRRQRWEHPAQSLVQQSGPIAETRAVIAFFATVAMFGVGGIVLMLMDPLPSFARVAGLIVSSVLLVVSIGGFVRWWLGSDLEDDDEDSDSEPDPDDAQVTVPA
jgi:hypothetical protein